MRVSSPPSSPRAANSTASPSTVTALATRRPPGFSACQQRSTRPGVASPPPMKTASGRRQSGQRRRRLARRRSPAPARRARSRSRRSCRGAAASRSTAIAAHRAVGAQPFDARPSRSRRRRPTAAAPASGASAARVAARTSRLVSWPSCRKASSGRPAGADALAAAGPAMHSTAIVLRSAVRADGPVRGGRLRGCRSCGAAHMLEHGQAAGAIADGAASSAATSAGVVPSWDSSSSRAPAQATASNRASGRPWRVRHSHLGERPAEPRRGQREGRDAAA